MPIYDVIIARERYETAVVRIQSASGELAVDRALLAKNVDWLHENDEVLGSPFVLYVKEVKDEEVIPSDTSSGYLPVSPG